MLKKLNNGQLEKLLYHTIGINHILTESLTDDKADAPFSSGMASGVCFEDIRAESDKEFPPLKETPARPFVNDYYEYERRQKEYDLSRLCGRWTAGKNRCGIEISRAGEHFILTYLKRNGYPSDERYLLMWFDGDILYYGYQDRMTSLALNSESDTLIISPGMDYTRVPETGK